MSQSLEISSVQPYLYLCHINLPPLHVFTLLDYQLMDGSTGTRIFSEISIVEQLSNKIGWVLDI